MLTDAERDRVADIFTTHQRFVESVARQHAPAPDHVPDIVQAVAVLVCRSLDSFRGDAEVRTWLYRVTVNASRDYYRSEYRHTIRPRESLQQTPPPEPYVDPDEQAIQGQRVDALYDAVGRLKPLYADLIREEIAGSAVLSFRKSSRHRARQLLRMHLSDDPRLDD